MQEFMLRVLNNGDEKSTMSPEKHQEFLQQCERYIDHLKTRGELIAAQPLSREGTIISGSNNTWNAQPLDAKKEMQVGYYHIFADDLNEAIAIAKENPEFEYSSTARVEVRPIKTKETSTGFVYPKS